MFAEGNPQKSRLAALAFETYLIGSNIESRDDNVDKSKDDNVKELKDDKVDKLKDENVDKLRYDKVDKLKDENVDKLRYDNVEKKIREFLTEDSIIKRTKNCKNYFIEHVPPIAAITNVRKRIQLTSL
jgi:hypothetical protein